MAKLKTSSTFQPYHDASVIDLLHWDTSMPMVRRRRLRENNAETQSASLSLKTGGSAEA